MLSNHTNGHRLFLFIFAIPLLLLLLHMTATQASAQAMTCSDPYLIDEEFPNGARWEMCWEQRAKEGIVYYDVHYTTPSGIRRKVLGQANLAQIHVPYDDNSARYHDITSFSLPGVDISHLSLTAGECPNGTRLLNGTGAAVICQQIELDHDYAYRVYSPIDYKLASHMTLFNLARINRYYYVISWDFHDDGSISPEIGATGALQQFGYSSADPNVLLYGWPVSSWQGNPTTGVSHIHNYWWRLDFDLGGNMDDVAEEIEFIPSASRTKWTISTTQFTTETARTVSQETFRFWRVLDKSILNGDQHNISYELQPNASNTFRGPSYEPWTQNDIYFTVGKACEVFATENDYVNADGCDKDVSEFVNGELIDGSNDLVVWYGATFHHLPRDEDDFPMPIHMEGFHIVPRDWTAENPYNASPEVVLGITESQITTDTDGLPVQQTFVLMLSGVFVVGVVLIRARLQKK